MLLSSFRELDWINLQIKLSLMRQLASHADVLRGSSRFPAPRTARTRDEPLRSSLSSPRGRRSERSSGFKLNLVLT